MCPCDAAAHARASHCARHGSLPGPGATQKHTLPPSHTDTPPRLPTLRPTHAPPLPPPLQNFLALIPLALILGEVTEDLAVRFGDIVGGLLNATFGNVVEL